MKTRTVVYIKEKIFGTNYNYIYAVALEWRLLFNTGCVWP